MVDTLLPPFDAVMCVELGGKKHSLDKVPFSFVSYKFMSVLPKLTFTITEI